MEVFFTPSKHPIPIINKIPLHSKINPLKEQQFFLKAEEQNRPLIIFGLGFGYHLPLNKDNKNPILVVEPNQKLYQGFLKHRPSISHLIIFSKSVEEFLPFLQKFFKNSHLKNLLIKVHQPSVKAFGSIYQPYLTIAQQFQEQGLLNLITDSAFGPLWALNTFKNLSFSLKAPTFLNKSSSPTVLLGSGSSLLETLDFIKKRQDKIIIAAIPPLLGLLKKEKITPDFIFLSDPGYANRHYLLDLPHNIPLLTYLTASHLFIKHWKGPVFFFNSRLAIDQFLIPEFPAIPSSGSVANNLLELAFYISPQVGFAGLDFSFLNYAYHYTGNPLELAYTYLSYKTNPLEGIQYSLTHPEGSPLWLSSFSKQKVPTNTAMFSYYQDFCAKIKHFQKPCYQLSPNGVFFPHCLLASNNPLLWKKLPPKNFQIVYKNLNLPLKSRLENLKKAYLEEDLNHAVLQMHLARFILKKHNSKNTIHSALKHIQRLLERF